MAELRVWGDEQLVAVLLHMQGAVKYPVGAAVQAGKRGFRAGDILAKDDQRTGDHLVVCKYTEIAIAASSGDTTITVDDAHPFEIGDSVTIATQAARTVSAINYTTNVITFSAGIASNAAVDAAVRVTTGNQDEAVAIANTPLVDRYAYRNNDLADLKTPLDVTSQYGDAYVMGTFKSDVIQNGNFRNGSAIDSDFGGRYNANNNTYVIFQVSAHYEFV